jgi:uncharacterized membrane protein
MALSEFRRSQLTAANERSSIYASVVQFPVVCFTLALITDIVFLQTSLLMWAEFSAWLLLAGMVTGALAAVFGVVEFVLQDARALWPAAARAIGGGIVLVLAFINNLVHAGDGWTSVVPWGLTLSALTVVVMVVTALCVRFPRRSTQP